MKYLPLILLLLFACKKESKENPQPQQQQVAPPPPQNQTKNCYSGSIIDTVYYNGTTQEIRKYHPYWICRIYGMNTVVEFMCTLTPAASGSAAINNQLAPYGISFEAIGAIGTFGSDFKLTTTLDYDSAMFKYRFYSNYLGTYINKDAIKYFQ